MTLDSGPWSAAGRHPQARSGDPERAASFVCE